MNAADKRELLEWANEEKTFLFELAARIRLHERVLDERVKKMLAKKKKK